MAAATFRKGLTWDGSNPPAGPMKKPLTTNFEKGRTAALREQSRNRCPFRRATPEGKEWIRGFERGQKELAEREAREWHERFGHNDFFLPI